MTETAPSARAAPDAAERWLLASGLAYAVAKLGVLVYFSAAVASKWPPVGAPFDERAAHYAADWERIAAANFLLPLPTPLLLLFLAGFYTALRRTEGGAGALSVAALVSGAAMALLWPLGMLVGGLAMEIGAKGGDPVTMGVLEGSAPLTLALAGLPRAVLVGTAGAVLATAGGSLRWVGWFGIALAPVTLLGVGTLRDPGLFPILALGLLLFLVWVGAAAFALIRAAGTAAPIGSRARAPAVTGGAR
jgi:hypothetical protein